jgi:signal transduction histidine kinase
VAKDLAGGEGLPGDPGAAAARKPEFPPALLAGARRGGQVVAAVVLVEDITENLSPRKQLRQMQKMESLGTLAGGIAHDFNNILSAILGFTQLALERETEDKRMRDNLSEVYQAGVRASELVHQILTFSRKSDIELRPLRIELIVKEALKLLRSTLPTSIDIETQDCREPAPGDGRSHPDAPDRHEPVHQRRPRHGGGWRPPHGDPDGRDG